MTSATRSASPSPDPLPPRPIDRSPARDGDGPSFADQMEAAQDATPAEAPAVRLRSTDAVSGPRTVQGRAFADQAMLRSGRDESAESPAPVRASRPDPIDRSPRDDRTTRADERSGTDRTGRADRDGAHDRTDTTDDAADAQTSDAGQPAVGTPATAAPTTPAGPAAGSQGAPVPDGAALAGAAKSGGAGAATVGGTAAPTTSAVQGLAGGGLAGAGPLGDAASVAGRPGTDQATTQAALAGEVAGAEPSAAAMVAGSGIGSPAMGSEGPSGARQAGAKPDAKATGKPAAKATGKPADAKQAGAGHPASGKAATPGATSPATASAGTKPEDQPAESASKDAKAGTGDGAAQAPMQAAAGAGKADGPGQAIVQSVPRAADTLPAVPTVSVAPPALSQTASQATMPAVAAGAVPLQHVAVTIAARAKAGESRFEIRLDPPDLGRIDVALQVDRTGAASATLTVERADTLSLLQGDQRSLERALADAGFKSDGASLQFSLRDGGQGTGQGNQGAGQNWQEGARTRRLLVPDAGGLAAPAALARYAAPALRLGGVDISI